MNWAGGHSLRRPVIDRPSFSARWAVPGCIAAAIGIGLLSNLVGLSDLVFWTFFLAATGLCVLNAVTVGRRPDGSLDMMAPAAPFSLVFFVMFVLGAAYGWTGLDQKPDHPNPLPALILATVGLAGYTLGYRLRVVSTARSVTHRLPAWRPRRALVAAAVCIVIGLVGTIASFRSVEYFAWTQKNPNSVGIGTQPALATESQLGFLSDFLFIGLTIVAILVASTMSKHRARLILIIQALIALAVLMPTGRRFYLFIVLSTVGFSWHYYISRIRPVYMITLAVFTVLVLNPGGQLWRSAYQTVGATGMGDVPAVTHELADELSRMDLGEYLDYATFHFERFNEAATVSALWEAVPSTLEYKYGKTYLPVVTWIVPRFIWHDKPTFQYFNEIGHVTGMIGPFDTATTIVYTSIGELYLNFGVLGVPLGMFAIGMLSRWLYQSLIAGTRNQAGLLFYGLLILPFWSVEEALGPAGGATLRDVVACWLVLRLTGAMGRGSMPSEARIGSPVGESA
jgi:hypothetical protein